MATATKTPEKYDVDAVIERLAALPNPERRRAFFAELETLPPFSRARIDLAEYGRRRLAPGPYYPNEYSTLVGITEPRRQLTANEIARQEDHAAAAAVVLERQLVWRDAIRATVAADRKVDRYDSFSDSANRKKYEEARGERSQCQEAQDVARDAWEEAMRLEVMLRAHQSEQKAAAGRNFLRWLKSGGAK